MAGKDFRDGTIRGSSFYDAGPDHFEKIFRCQQFVGRHDGQSFGTSRYALPVDFFQGLPKTR